MTRPRAITRPGRLLWLLVLLLGVTAAPSARADAEPPIATATTVVTADGSSGLTLRIPTTATANDAIKIDLQGQPAAMVQLVPRPCRFSEPEDWCPVAANLAIAASVSGGFDNDLPFVDSNANNILPGEIDVYVLSPGPVTVTLTLTGAPAGTTQVRTDRAVAGVLAEIPSQCPPQFGDCRTLASGHLVDTVGRLGSNFVHAYSKTSPNLGPGALVPNQAQSKSDLACGYTEDLGGSVDPDDHDGSCDMTPKDPDDDSWRQNNVNYFANATPISGPISRFGSYGPSLTGRVYLGFRAHALAANDSLEPQATGVGAWGAWLEAGLR